jgi:hypothetical protein
LRVACVFSNADSIEIGFCGVDIFSDGKRNR